MLELLGRFYGLDWLAMIISLLFLFLIGNKKRYGFIIYIIGNLAWIVVNIIAQIWPGIILNVVLIFLNYRAYLKWKK